MKTLLDTDIIVLRELGNDASQDIRILFRWLDRGGYTKCILPVTLHDINNASDLLTRQSEYELIKTPSPLADKILELSSQEDHSDKDKDNTLLLNEVYLGRVDLLITENKETHRKAQLLNIADRVLTIDSFLEKTFSEHPELVNYKVLNVQKIKFGKINLDDPFFDSLKADYPGFDQWFARKSNDEAYITINSNNGMLLSFLYLKVEGADEDYSNINPILPPKKRLKVGTFKVINNGFRLGERFLKIIFDNALKNRVEEIYVTVFDKRDEQRRLIGLLEQWGFRYWGMKGGEMVYVRDFHPHMNMDNLRSTYPYINANQNAYIVPIYPDYHTELLPDSILNTESPQDFIEDSPHRNSIGKIYVSRAMPPYPQKGDLLIFYRTGGYYKSVITTIGIVEELKQDFQNEEEFIKYCRRGSVFPEKELLDMWKWNSKMPIVLKFLYLYSFPHRINMENLINLGVLAGVNDAPRGFKPLTRQQLEIIIKETNSDDSFIIY